MAAKTRTRRLDSSGRRGLARVLAALWLGVSQAVVIGVFLFGMIVALVLSEGVSPFSSIANDPNFGFGALSGITWRASLPLLLIIVVGVAILGIVVGSWKLWVRRKHGRSVLV